MEAGFHFRRPLLTEHKADRTNTTEILIPVRIHLGL